MARSQRLQITVSPAMTVALEMLAERTGLTVSAQAMVLLRQSLERTIQSDRAQERLRQHTAQRNHATWQADMVADRAVEGVYQQFGAATQEEVSHACAPTARRAAKLTAEAKAQGWSGEVHDLAGEGLAHAEGAGR